MVHLGDYIYEGAQLGERAHNPPRIIFSLWDYRTRHGQVGNSDVLGFDEERLLTQSAVPH